jgi:hypothetical protein
MAPEHEARLAQKIQDEALDSLTASKTIEWLLAQPKVEVAKASSEEPEAGVWMALDGTLIRVYLGQQSKRMLAKRINLDPEGVSYEYVGAAARVITSTDRRLSLSEVGSLGRTFDHCLCCGARLDDPESVDRGIGPVCAKRYGG